MCFSLAGRDVAKSAPSNRRNLHAGALDSDLSFGRNNGCPHHGPRCITNRYSVSVTRPHGSGYVSQEQPKITDHASLEAHFVLVKATFF